MSQTKRLTGFIGAEVIGVDLKQPITDETADTFRRLLSEHQVLRIRNQFLNLEEQKRFTILFGPLMALPYVQALAEDDKVIAVLKEAGEINTGVFGGEWHSDFSFLENPPAGSVLSAVEIPEIGGDTLWASQVAAYQSLPKDLKEFVAGRDAIHVGAPYGVKHAPPANEKANASIQMTRGDPDADREIRHPAVITDPQTGTRSLFLNPIYTTRFEDMSEEESSPILQEIYKHCTRPDFSCRLHWRAGDVVVWDNRLCLHYATNDYDGARRLLYRTTFQRYAPA
ncbi:MAG: TauD/TfdA family dioxygenase [Proteobacteria bacterium]|nr:TauD/TfdA family dioxygenase [Pseudomonadota bacterium]